MPFNKPHKEFFQVDMEKGWETPEGYPSGIKQKILASDIDEAKKTGSRTRLLRFDPGTYTTAPFVHDHWEEVYLVSGDLTVGNDGQGRGGQPFKSPTYACRPPGAHHGPFKSEGGCLLYEIHYYDETKPFRG
jgi:hypothetical protein